MAKHSLYILRNALSIFVMCYYVLPARLNASNANSSWLQSEKWLSMTVLWLCRSRCRRTSINILGNLASKWSILQITWMWGWRSLKITRRRLKGKSRFSSRSVSRLALYSNRLCSHQLSSYHSIKASNSSSEAMSYMVASLARFSPLVSARVSTTFKDQTHHQVPLLRQFRQLFITLRIQQVVLPLMNSDFK